MSAKACRECDRRVEPDARHLANRSGGGAYNRAPRMIATTICTECVLNLAAVPLRGQRLVGGERWDATGLRWLAWRLLTPERVR